jgi:hypothetical protein
MSLHWLSSNKYRYPDRSVGWLPVILANGFVWTGSMLLLDAFGRRQSRRSPSSGPSRTNPRASETKRNAAFGSYQTKVPKSFIGASGGSRGPLG